jgi:hypothetical protein
MLKLIANQLDFLDGKFKGVRTEFSDQELRNADVILTTAEEAGMKPPLRKRCSVLLTEKDYWEPENA